MEYSQEVKYNPRKKLWPEAEKAFASNYSSNPPRFLLQAGMGSHPFVPLSRNSIPKRIAPME